jgi:hypothetical protein
MNQRFLSLAAIAATFVLAAPSRGQTTTFFPNEYQTAPGGTVDTYFPVAYGIARTQVVLDRVALNIPNGRQISALKFRQAPGGYTSVARSLQLAIFMGGTSRTSQTATGDFLANYTGGTPRTQVFNTGIFALPALTATSAPYGEVTIPLTTPYTYQASENLIVEFVVTANNNANQAFTYYLDAGYYLSPVTNFGTGCQTSANQIPALNGSGTYYGSSLAFSLTQAPANSTLYFQLNVAPSTPVAGGPFGAPGCTMLVAPLAGVLGTATGGQFYYSLPIPNQASFYGVDFYGQAIIFDLFANALGYAASNGSKITIGRLPPMTKIIAQGSATATTGSIQRQSGPVFGFVHN